MKERPMPSAAWAAGPWALCGAWAWALLASTDARIVLDCQVRLPIVGLSVASGVFFAAAPLVALAAFVAARLMLRKGWPILVPFPAALFLNAIRCLKLHDPVLSWLTAGMAMAGTAWAACEWLASRPFRGKRASIQGILTGAGFAVAAGLEAVLVLSLVPWSLRGDLPGRMNDYPFGPALRSVIFADLSGYVRPVGGGPRSLRGLHLEGANLRKAVFKGADLRGANLYRARLELADFEGADLRGVRLVEARLSFVNFRRADLSEADLSGAYSMGADLRNAVLRGATHHYQRFCNADARGADFDSSRLSKVFFFGSDLRGASFRNASVPYPNLVRVDLTGADLTGANLPGADLHQAVLRGTLLGSVNLGAAVRLTPEALAEAATLRDARLDPPLSDEMRRRAPGLF